VKKKKLFWRDILDFGGGPLTSIFNFSPKEEKLLFTKVIFPLRKLFEDGFCRFCYVVRRKTEKKKKKKNGVSILPSQLRFGSNNWSKLAVGGAVPSTHAAMHAGRPKAWLLIHSFLHVLIQTTSK
jgi:hypothetical protein